jgi:hypothetical protein
MQRGPSRQQKKTTLRLAVFLNYLAFLQPAANRAVSVLPRIVSQGRSYGFLCGLIGIFKKMGGRAIQLLLIRRFVIQAKIIKNTLRLTSFAPEGVIEK